MIRAAKTRRSTRPKLNITGTVNPEIYRTIEDLANTEKKSRSAILNEAIIEGFKSPVFADRLNKIRGYPYDRNSS